MHADVVGTLRDMGPDVLRNVPGPHSLHRKPHGEQAVGLLCFRKHKRFDGELCLLYLGGYGLGRFIIEGIVFRILYIDFGFFNIS